MWVWILSVFIFGYANGCLHGSVVAQKISGVNLKETGVKNAGASNAAIVLGKKFGALVAAIDIGKGAVSVLVVRFVAARAGLPEDMIVMLLFLAGVAAIIGHNFPFYMNFDGGKGTATMIGVLLALDWRFGLAGFTLFVIVALVTDFLVLGVLMLYITMLVIAVWLDGYWPMLIAVLLITMAVWKHIENFRRMKDGSEKRVSAVFKKK
ncbi:glycerol-3-phosphate acyltransferase [Sporosarcina limicola]|uniref:Glycerol-3-phosphate acyltransferase n=1 Tax=Sporosarcina limicola TaxID=34101 RepID=A0A927MJ31_9BACL|nr:glycerol-3-phosphate acyltransferase [Sporosarcina limicola]MBE1555325.1 glycerol-3-phosphate acyltransferase PlsY [Sporosarcina limicola]